MNRLQKCKDVNEGAHRVPLARQFLACKTLVAKLSIEEPRLVEVELVFVGIAPNHLVNVTLCRLSCLDICCCCLSVSGVLFDVESLLELVEPAFRELERTRSIEPASPPLCFVLDGVTCIT